MSVFNLSIDNSISEYRCTDQADNLTYHDESPILDCDQQLHGGSLPGMIENHEHLSIAIEGDFEPINPRQIALLCSIVEAVGDCGVVLVGLRCAAIEAQLIYRGTAPALAKLKCWVEEEPICCPEGVEWREAEGNWQPIDGAGLKALLVSEIQRLGAANCNLSGVDLCSSDLSGVNLVNADLSQANLQDVNLRGANLTGAKLNMSRLIDVDFSGATLVGAKLIGAKAIGCNLSYADLSDANLSNANLSKANLSHTKLDRAKLTATRFVYSRGLSRTEQADLQKHRGAIF